MAPRLAGVVGRKGELTLLERFARVSRLKGGSQQRMQQGERPRATAVREEEEEEEVASVGDVQTALECGR